MRILQLMSSSGFYGAERVVAMLSSHLAALECEVTIGLFNAKTLADRTRFGSEEKQTPPVWDLQCTGRFDLMAVSRLAHYLRETKTDLLHTHGYKADIYGILAARLAGCRVVATCHNWTNRSMRLQRYAALDKRMLRSFDRVFAVSNTVSDTLLQEGFPSSRIQVIENGVETEPHPRPGITSTEKRSLVLGALTRLSPEKGVDVLIRALPQIRAEFPEIQCVVLGEGPERRRLTTLAAELGVASCLHMPGVCADTTEFLTQCTVLVHPSRVEGMPLAILEAMAASKPIVASAVGGIPKLLRGGHAGVLVAPEDPVALANGVLLLLRNERLRAHFAEEASSFVRAHFDASIMAAAYLRAYSMLCRTPARARSVRYA